MIEPWLLGVMLIPIYMMAVKWLGDRICWAIAQRWPRVAEILMRVR